jgi:hypothetical protein
MEVIVVLNGTNQNPYERYGMRRNPFHAIPYADQRFAAANEILADLDANPIRNVEDLRRRLDGCTAEFIELCTGRYQRGKRVKFSVYFPDPGDA